MNIAPKYHRRARVIAQSIRRSWGICYRQALEEAWRCDPILILARADLTTAPAHACARDVLNEPKP